VTAMQITDEMVKAADAAFEASLSRYHGSGFNGYDFFPQIRAALEAVLPMIRAGVLVANEEAEFVECILADVPVVVQELSGLPVVAFLRDMQTRKVIGIRVYSAAAIRALEQKP
jgi:hypothetical protein